ncbi:MAG TPA: hypothetical protein VIM71_06380 [Lacunisphaera sp.]
MREQDMAPKQVAALLGRSRRTFYRLLDGTAGPSAIARVTVVFPSLAHIGTPQQNNE